MEHSVWADPPPATDQRTSRQSSTPLSAAAPTFAPDTTAPPPDAASADQFAQTGPAQDDLFDDVVPVEESMRLRSDDDLFSEDFTPAPQLIVESQRPPSSRTHTDASRGRGRGKGRVHQDRGDSARTSAQGAELPGSTKHGPSTQAQSQSLGNTLEHAPSGPRTEPGTAVRGDRRATGGIRKPKLTEEELAEKMARIQIKNASLTAAHARAEADAASFEQREQQAKHVSNERRKEERRDRQQMMGEREKNRQRKLKAIEGREWDAEKNEDDFGRGGRYDGKGFAGDQQGYTDGREYLYQEPKGGGRGRGGGRGGRGERAAAATVPTNEDFPALPGSGGPVGRKEAERSSLPGLAGSSWADQVEANPST